MRTRDASRLTRRAASGVTPRGELVVGVLLAGLVAGLCFLYLWQASRLRELTAASEDARRRLDAAQEVNRILSVRIEEAFALERIARLAREQLNMAEPDAAHTRYAPLPSDESD